MDTLKIKAEKRDVFGRKVKRLRKEGVTPANVFGKKIKSFAIQLKEDEFKKVYKEAGETGLIQLELESKKHPVLVHDMQRDPVSGNILHVDFVQVDLKEKIEAQVPVEIVGESPAEKQGVGTIVQYVNEITVEALPGDFPESFDIDVSKLEEVDAAIQIKDIKVDAKVEIKDDVDKIVVKVEAPQEEEVVEPVVSEEVGETTETETADTAANPEEKSAEKE